MIKLFDILPILGGGTGGAGAVLLTITWGAILNTILLASIGAVVGGIIGFLVSIAMKKLWKRCFGK